MSGWIARSLKHVAGNMIRTLYYAYLRASGVEIGSNTMISLGAKIDMRRGKIIIGDGCTITHGTVVLSHDAAATIMGKERSEDVTVIENNVFIGVNSVILPGVTIGKNSIVGAGSIVSKSVPPFSLVVGNPARKLKSLKL